MKSLVCGATVDEQALQNHISHFCGLGERIAGSVAEAKACAYITENLRAWGIPHQVYEFEALISNPLSARLEMPGLKGGSLVLEGVGAAFSVSTPEGGLKAQVVCIGAGKEADYKGQDVQGKLVLFDGLVSAMQAHHAARHGAAGMIGIAEGPMPQKNTTGTAWGNPDSSQLGALPRLPVVCLNLEQGKSLQGNVRKALASGTAFTATLHNAMEEGVKKILLPVAEVPSKRPEFILAGGHYCSWFDGATDNATGNAALLELARLFFLAKKQLQFGVRIAWWPGHSQGRFCGSAWYAETFWQDLYDHCVGYYNIDSPGSRGSSLLMPRYQMAEATAFNERCLVEAAPERAVLELQQQLQLVCARPEPGLSPTRPDRAADQSFWGIGITSLSVYSMLPQAHPDRCASVGGSGGAWWWHSKQDTVDKADAVLLADDTRVFFHTLFQLASGKLLPWDFSATTQDYALALKHYAAALEQAEEDRLNLRPLLEDLAELRTRAATFRVFMDSLISSTDKNTDAMACLANRLCLSLTRLLVPTLYTRISEVSITEQQAAFSSRLLPDLEPMLNLHKLDYGSQERLCLVWSLRRKLTRVHFSIIQALRSLEDWQQ